MGELSSAYNYVRENYVTLKTENITAETAKLKFSRLRRGGVNENVFVFCILEGEGARYSGLFG